MTRTLLCNLNRCRRAHDLLEQTLDSGNYDLALVSEPNQARVKGSRWEVDLREDVAIWTSKRAQRRRLGTGRGDGYVWMDMEAVVIYSCDISPNITKVEYEEFLDGLESSVAAWSQGKLIAVAGDFNAAADYWGVPRRMPEGRC